MKNIFNLKDIITPKPGMVVYGPSWWVCQDGDPKKALFYGNAPQANIQKSIVEHSITNGLYINTFDNLSAVFVEIAFIPMRD